MLWLKKLLNPLLPENIKMNFVNASNTATLPQPMLNSGMVSSPFRKWWSKLKQTFLARNQRSAMAYFYPQNELLGHDPKKYYEIHKAAYHYDAAIAGLKAI